MTRLEVSGGPPPGRIAAHLRLLGLALAIACTADAIYAVRVAHHAAHAWQLLAAALILAIVAQHGIILRGSALEPAPAAAGRWRVGLGILVALCGTALWVWATDSLYQSWRLNYDKGWLGWLLATMILGIGADLAWGTWRRPRRARPLRAIWLLLCALVLVAAVYRFGTFVAFPGRTEVTQVEELQVGGFGEGFLHGDRTRWEFLSHTWLAALGIKLGGPTLLAMRLPFAAASVLKTIPLFFWLRFAVGTVGAAVGTTLLAFSFWDVMLARIPTNQDTLVIALAFALLAGPARRGRPSAYVWLGFLGGYTFYQYVAYRPLVAFVLLGATMMSLRDASAGWWRRLARPMITLLLVASMGVPLFLGLLRGPRFWNEYFNGWNRAHAQEAYYNPHDTWDQATDKRLERSFKAVGLFFFAGDGNPAHNVAGRPLVDPITATLLLLGVAYGLAHLPRNVFGLTVLALVVTVAGTMVATGNWDVGRVSVAGMYVYATAGYGAASLAEALGSSGRRAGRIAALAILAATVLVAGYLNSRTLGEYLTSPVTRRAEFSKLVYLNVWLRDHARPDERVEGITPLYTQVIGPNDAAWLRERTIPGTLAGNIESALRDWAAHPGPALLFVSSGPSTRDVQRYLQWLFPELHMQWDPGPPYGDGAIAYIHASRAPTELAERLIAWRSQGVSLTFTFSGPNPHDVLARVATTAPFIDITTWPDAARIMAERLRPKFTQAQAKIHGDFTLQEAGTYTFNLESIAGLLRLSLDGRPVPPVGAVPLHLAAGPHTVDINGVLPPFAVAQGMARLWWRSSKTSDRPQIVPFYRLQAAHPPGATMPAVNVSRPPA